MRFNLRLLQQRFDQQVATLRFELLTTPTVPVSEYCVIQLQDAWTRFCRDLILRSSIGNANRAGGTKIIASIREEHDAVDLLRSRWRGGNSRQPPYWEPSWFDTQQAAKALSLLRPGNTNDINAALGSSANPIDELRPLRNYVAHRGPTSNAALLAWAVDKHLAWHQPLDLLLQPAAGGSTRFEEWCVRFLAVAAAAVK